MVPRLVALLTAVHLVASLGPAGDDSESRHSRVPIPKPATIVRPSFESSLTVKFRDELRARATEGSITSTVGADLVQLESVTDRYDLSYEQLVRLPQERLDALEARAAARSGRAQPDLAGMMMVRGPDVQLERVAQELLGLDVVEWVEFSELRPEPPCSDLPPVTPDYVAQGLQGYHDPDPGVNALHLWSLGARGAGIQIADCEYGHIQGTEDLCNVADEPGQTVDPGVAENGWDNHGTAVLGEIVGLDNSYGVTGLAPDADALFFTEWSVEEGFRRQTAIANAIATVDEGDIVVLEMQTASGGDYGPAELSLAVWNLTKTGTDAGVIVVAAAGNGNEDLDSAAYASYRERGDSGAIIVGAGTDSTSHSKLSFSTYGSRVDVQGWGQNVFTLGYGSYAAHGGDPRQRYTAGFSGTSSATPIVAGSVALLQSLAEQSWACRLDPGEMRQLLIDTGLPQGSGGHIGPFPDLEAASDALLAEGDCYWPYCGNGIREGVETCDGADTGSCPGSCATDCSCAPQTPGEAGNLLVDRSGPSLSISFDRSCESSDHTIVSGLLQDVNSYGYSSQICGIGTSGDYGPFSLGPGSRFFLVVANDGVAVEGSYGQSSAGLERPELLTDHPNCPFTQDLLDACE